jgi:probable rRNA maturation factor
MPTRSTRRRNRVSIQLAVPRRGVPSAASLRRWTLGFTGLSLRIVGEREGRALNYRYAGKNKATNVLAFPYDGGRGDIVLCHPVIAREARAQGKTLRAHYAHLVVHGVLHLRGHRHDRKPAARAMENREIRILRRLGFGDPYAVK